MRAWLAIGAVCCASTVSADVTVTVAGPGVPAALAPCAAALQSWLHARYPRSGDDEHYCERAATARGVSFRCYGACTDRSCHNDACTRHDDALDVSLALDDQRPSPWRRDARYSWQIRWTRGYGAVVAELVQYGDEPRARVPERALRRLQRAIDACVAVP